MSVKYVILNFLLCIVVLMVGAKNYETWSHPIELVSNKEVGKKSVVKAEIPPTIKVAKEPASIRSYILISQKNIFSPERKDFPIVPDPLKKPFARPQIILYGVTITENVQFATLLNPGRPLRKGEREMMTLKVGEQIGGYKIARVLPDRVAMENTGDTFEVLLYDPNMPKRRIEVQTEIKPTLIINPQGVSAPIPNPTEAEASKVAPPQVSLENPKEPIQQQIANPTPQPSRRYPIPPTTFGGRRTFYSPPYRTSGVPAQQNTQ